MSADAGFSMRAMMQSDVVVVIMFPHGKDEVWVEVTKNRYGYNSRHAFANLMDAEAYIRTLRVK